jgi:hypothetical protein
VSHGPRPHEDFNTTEDRGLMESNSPQPSCGERVEFKISVSEVFVDFIYVEFILVTIGENLLVLSEVGFVCPEAFRERDVPGSGKGKRETEVWSQRGRPEVEAGGGGRRPSTPHTQMTDRHTGRWARTRTRPWVPAGETVASGLLMASVQGRSKPRQHWRD